MKKKFDNFRAVTDRVIEQMREFGSDWTKPFASLFGLPFNAVTKKQYRGSNIIILMMQEQQYWAGYSQWRSIGAQVRKGEHGTYICRPQTGTVEEKNPATGLVEERTYQTWRWNAVYSADQVDGFEVPHADTPDLTTVLANVDSYLANTGAVVREGERACYMPSIDEIRMPRRKAFSATPTSTATECFYSTQLHETSHWTGHETRLDRLTEKNKKGYAFEELVAELSAAILCVMLGVSNTPRPDHAQYLNNWIQALESDSKYLFQAATKAFEAVEYLDSLQNVKDVAA